MTKVGLSVPLAPFHSLCDSQLLKTLLLPFSMLPQDARLKKNSLRLNTPHSRLWMQLQQGLLGTKPQICNAKNKAEMRTGLLAWFPKETKLIREGQRHCISIISAFSPNIWICWSALTLLYRGEETTKFWTSWTLCEKMADWIKGRLGCVLPLKAGRVSSSARETHQLPRLYLLQHILWQSFNFTFTFKLGLKDTISILKAN